MSFKHSPIVESLNFPFRTCCTKNHVLDDRGGNSGGDFNACIENNAAHRRLEIIKYRGRREHPLRERALDRINFKVTESITDIGENKTYYYANDCEMQVALGSALRNKLQMIVFRFNAARRIAESSVRITWVVSLGECNKR